MLASERRCTRMVHAWLVQAIGLKAVANPHAVLSLDVDGVLEDESSGFSCTGLTGAAALRLLELGQVAALPNTARSLSEVRERVAEFLLLGGVGAFGSTLWDAVNGQEYSLVTGPAEAQLDRLRTALRADQTIVMDSSYQHSVRASAIIDGEPRPIPGAYARTVLDRNRLNEITFWVAPRHTDFVDRSVDKGTGITRLAAELALDSLPLASLGDAACDVPMLRIAKLAFIPAASLPSYVATRRQRLRRSRHLGEQALWDAACHLVSNLALQRQVLATVDQLVIPDWFPPGVAQRPRRARPVFTRMIRRSH
jgi:hypothetical protein